MSLSVFIGMSPDIAPIVLSSGFLSAFIAIGFVAIVSFFSPGMAVLPIILLSIFMLLPAFMALPVVSAMAETTERPAATTASIRYFMGSLLLVTPTVRACRG